MAPFNCSPQKEQILLVFGIFSIQNGHEISYCGLEISGNTLLEYPKIAGFGFMKLSKISLQFLHRIFLPIDSLFKIVFKPQLQAIEIDKKHLLF